MLCWATCAYATMHSIPFASLRHLSPWLLLSISRSLFLHDSPSCHRRLRSYFMLLGAGAESSSGLGRFLEESDHLPNGKFRRILWTLVENARPAPFDRNQEPPISIMRSSRVLSLSAQRHQNTCSTERSLKMCLGKMESLRRASVGSILVVQNSTFSICMIAQ